LYNKLIEYLTKHLTEIKEGSQAHSDEALIDYYINEWERYTVAAKFINHLFRYLNRHWVKREMDEGKKNIYDVYTVWARELCWNELWLTVISFIWFGGDSISSTMYRNTLWRVFFSSSRRSVTARLLRLQW
jgi:cullin 1